MSRYAEHNSIAVFRKMHINGVQVKKYTGGHPYTNNGLLVRCSVLEPIYSYAKNYTRFKQEFSLFVWTTESDGEGVISEMDKLAKTLKKDQIMPIVTKVSSFSYVGTLPELVK